MAKKLSMLLAAVAVLAFAVPAIASAAPSITSSEGVLASVGSVVSGSSTNAVTKTSVWRGQRQPSAAGERQQGREARGGRRGLFEIERRSSVLSVDPPTKTAVQR
jgi:hypothetical protein